MPALLGFTALVATLASLIVTVLPTDLAAQAGHDVG